MAGTGTYGRSVMVPVIVVDRHGGLQFPNEAAQFVAVREQ